MLTQSQLDLARAIIAIANGDADGEIDEQTLEIALEYLHGNFVPLGEHDAIAFPVPGRPLQVLIDGDYTYGLPNEFLALVCDPHTGERRVLRCMAGDPWEEVCDPGEIREFKLWPPENELACVHWRGEERIILWGEGWEVPLPVGASWRLMRESDDPTLRVDRLIRILDGQTLLLYSESLTEPVKIDVSGVTPPWHADEPTATKVCRDPDGGLRLMVHGETPRIVGGARTQVFYCGGEFITVDDQDPERPGLKKVKSLETDREAVIRNAGIRVLDLAATDLHLVVTCNLDVSGDSREHAVTRPQIMIRNRDGSSRVREEGDRIADHWHPLQVLEATIAPGIGRMVPVIMGRHEEDRPHHVVETGVMIYTDRGHAFYPLRGVSVDHLQVFSDALWGWRPTPGGIILSRYPLPA